MKFTKRFKGQLLKTVTVAALAVSVAAPNSVSAYTVDVKEGYNYRTVSDKVNTVTSEYAPTYYNSGNYSESDPLYAATHFHIFASDDVQFYTHTNGNIATNFMSNGGSNSGTKDWINEIPEVSYVKDFLAISDKILWDDKSELAVGSDVTVGSFNNGYGFTLKGSTADNAVEMNNATVKNVYQEEKGGASYIDMDAEFAKLKKLSKGLSRVEATDDSSIFDFADNNKRSINVDMSKDYSVIDVNAYDLAIGTPITINGYDEAGSNSLIFNVDLKDYPDNFYEGAKIVYVTVNGEDINNKERNTWEYGKVLWNFYDSSSEDGCYYGAISINNTFLGTVLAPCAAVSVNQNLDGSVICRTFEGRAETHRNDFTGNIPLIASEADDTTSTESTTAAATAETSTETTTVTDSTTETTNASETTTVETTTETTTVETSTETTTVTDSTSESTTKKPAIGGEGDDKTTSTTAVVTDATTESTTASTTVTETTTENQSGGDKKTTTTTVVTEASTETTTNTASTTETKTESTTASTTEAKTESTTASTTETTTKAQGGEGGDKYTTTESTTEVVTGIIEPTTETTTSSSDESTTEPSTSSEESGSTTETTEETETTEPNTEDTTDNTTEITTREEDTTSEDVTTSGQATTVSDVTTTETTKEQDTETTTASTTETTTSKGGHAIGGEGEDNTGESTTVDFATETTTSNNGHTDGDGEDKTGETTTAASSDGTTETTTNKSGISSSTGEDKDHSTGGSGSSGGGTGIANEGKDAESTTNTIVTEAEATTETTTDEGDSTDAGEDKVSRSGGGGSSSKKASVQTSDSRDKSKDDPSENEDGSGDSNGSGSSKTVGTGDNTPNTDTDTGDVNSSGAAITDTGIDNTDSTVEPATVSSNDPIYTIASNESNSEGGNTAQANGAKGSLPQTGSIFNTKTLYCAGIGLALIGIFFVLKSKRKTV